MADPSATQRDPAGVTGPTPDTAPPPRRPFWLVLLAVFAINFLLVNLIFPGPRRPVQVPYTTFREQVRAGNVEAIATRADMVQGTFAEPLEIELPNGTHVEVGAFSTTLPAFVDPGLEALLLDHGVVINAEPLETPRSPLLTLLLTFGPTLLLIGIFVWLSRRMAAGLNAPGSGLFGLGQSRARRYDQADVKVTFDDVAGIDEAEAELAEIVDFLKNPEKYTRLGGTAPKGVLLVGAPGTGKTLLAKAVAGEAGVPFFSMNASEFVEMVVGVGASRVRDLFEQARKAAPAIIFIDELDAIGRSRGAAVFSGNSEQEQTLNQILTEMDGFSSREGVIVLAATNRPDVLDSALLRSGRFDRRVTVNPPDRNGREKILEVHTRDVPLDPDVSLAGIAGITPGLVGADLRNLVNEAALQAARRGGDTVTHSDFAQALEKMVLGPKRPLALTPQDRERIAYHEAGHALLGLVVPEADPVSRVTITPRGQSLGVTYQRPDDDRYNYPEAYLRARIIGALGGRAAEELVYGDRTTGAENDLEQVTRLATQMVTRWGMNERVGPLSLTPRQDPYLASANQAGGGLAGHSQATAELVDREVRELVDECYRLALQLLREHRAELDRLAATLLERETLDEAEILAATGLG
ncbi:MAG: ATP-dependent zinc metalloprotease FtsH [Deinococcales bacterium]|nr:ATP-dependent zinc metalloprotease FtsH [Deinococcales bacterium]